MHDFHGLRYLPIVPPVSITVTKHLEVTSAKLILPRPQPAPTGQGQGWPVVTTALLVARTSQGVTSVDNTQPKRYEHLRPPEENRPPNFDWESAETISCKD